MHEPIINATLWDAAHAVLAGNRNQLAGRTRSTEPALLRGLIFTETGAAMTPHHTKKGNRRYCYYISMDVIQKRPTAELRGPQRLPAAVVEDAVIGEIRRLLRTPEMSPFSTALMFWCLNSTDPSDRSFSRGRSARRCSALL